MDTNYEVIVIGAGIEGSSTAYQLSRAGTKTLLLEQFELPHTEGSSHGLSRMTRRAYDQDQLACLMEETLAEWRQLEQFSGERIFVKTGVVQVVKKALKYNTLGKELMKKYKAPFHELNATTIKKEFPQAVYSEEYDAFVDEDSGILLANKGLGALQDTFKKNQGVLVDNCTVKKINPGPIVTVETTKGTFTAKSVVICAGTWAGNIAADLGLKLPLECQRPYFMYWKEKVPGAFAADKGALSFIDMDEDIYGLASVEHPGLVKISVDCGVPFDINKPGDDDKPPYNLEGICQYVKDHFPGLESTPDSMTKCKYTVTPDHVFILDRHPQHKNIIFGAGFSGKGFKFGPVVGNILRDLALNITPKYDMQPYSINRFNKQ